MQSTFEQRLRAAVRAGWWTFLVGVIVVSLNWAVFLAITSRRPEWARAMWGPHMTWPSLERHWLSALLTIRIVLFALGMVVVWATLWSAALRKRVTVAQLEEIGAEPALPVMTP